MISWLASGGPPYIPTTSPSPAPSPDPGQLLVAGSGLNIGQLLGILLPLIVCAIAVLTYRDIRINRKQAEQAEDIRTAVSHFTDVLGERLETKENVALIRIRVGQLSTEVATLREVIRELNRTVEQIQSRRRGTS